MPGMRASLVARLVSHPTIDFGADRHGPLVGDVADHGAVPRGHAERTLDRLPEQLGRNRVRVRSEVRRFPLQRRLELRAVLRVVGTRHCQGLSINHFFGSAGKYKGIQIFDEIGS